MAPSVGCQRTPAAGKLWKVGDLEKLDQQPLVIRLWSQHPAINALSQRAANAARAHACRRTCVLLLGLAYLRHPLHDGTCHYLLSEALHGSCRRCHRRGRWTATAGALVAFDPRSARFHSTTGTHPGMDDESCTCATHRGSRRINAVDGPLAPRNGSIGPRHSGFAAKRRAQA